MEKQFEIELDEISNKFSSFYTMLERLPEFIKFKREIKLNTVLYDNKKIQFDIENTKGSATLFGTTGITQNNLTGLNEISFKIKSMSFIIKNDSVEKLLITIDSLETENGRIVENIMSSNLSLSLKINYINGMIHPNGNFFLDIEKPLD